MYPNASRIALALVCTIPWAPLAARESARLDPASIEDRADAQTLRFGDKGAAVLRAQILLERAHFSPGELDADFGSNMRQALAGFQQQRGLPASGELDPDTWAALNLDDKPLLARHAIAEAEVAGPFTRVPSDMMQKAELPALGYASPLEALAEKFHSAPRLLQALNPGKDLARAGTEIVVPDVQAGPLPAAATLVVDASDATLSLLDAEGKAIAQFPASMGSEHDPLPVGEWKITGVHRDPVFHYNPALFWDADPTHAKAAIKPGPNNPVGVVWIDLSKPNYGIHGTPEPARIGKTQSHGCIRLTNWSAALVADAVSTQTPAILQE
jgi:lipoprotein-anchoring transpeptidase ErfK/SrfK